HPAGKRSPQLPTPPELVNEGPHPARGLDRSCRHFLSQRVKLQHRAATVRGGDLAGGSPEPRCEGDWPSLENPLFGMPEGNNVGRRAISGLTKRSGSKPAIASHLSGDYIPCRGEQRDSRRAAR